MRFFPLEKKPRVIRVKWRANVISRLRTKRRAWKSVLLQIIITKDFLKLAQYIKLKIIPNDNLQVLYVLGRYSLDFESKASDLDPFIMVQKKFFTNIDWAVCAFGKKETDCLLRALSMGGKTRIGFENNFYNLVRLVLYVP